MRQCQDNKTLRRDGACGARPILTFLYIDVTCTLDCWPPEDAEEFPENFQTGQSNRKRARKSTPSLENANCSGCFSIFWDDICTYDFSTRDASCLFPYLSSASQDRKSAGDVIGHKCAGLSDIVYWCHIQTPYVTKITIQMPPQPRKTPRKHS